MEFFSSILLVVHSFFLRYKAYIIISLLEYWPSWFIYCWVENRYESYFGTDLLHLEKKTKGQNHDLLDLYLADLCGTNRGLRVNLHNNDQNGQNCQKRWATVKNVNMVKNGQKPFKKTRSKTIKKRSKTVKNYLKTVKNGQQM